VVNSQRMHASARLYSILGLCALSIALTPHQASAFCGFYVGGADASLYNDATMVVLMRDGTRTVLSMQNTYEGPPEGFALVIPVPEVLQEENVRTLPASVFQRVDRLAAPRLVEYWEQDPCAPPPPPTNFRRGGRRPMAMSASRQRNDSALGVTVEAEFAVGEYDIVVLSAEESDGLERWLVQENYNIPAGAGRTLAPYVQLGTKFFVAKVDPARVTFSEGRALLSPLRFHYDDERLALPIRLGLLNSRGTQNLIVHVLAKGTRYEAANYPNVTIPTNLVVANETRDHFGAFYRSIFDRVTEQNPGAVVTEYSWSAMSCDPCPEPALRPNELQLLGADVMPGGTAGEMRGRGRGANDWVLTRLHHRYGPEGASRDLVFREAPPIIGGRGMPDSDGKLQEQHSAAGSSYNNFQGRYVMLNPWEGPVSCANPTSGRWGGPSGRSTPPPTSPPSALAPRSGAAVDLAQAVVEADQRFLAVSATAAAEPNIGILPEPEPEPEARPQSHPQPPPRAMPVEPRGGCASCAVGASSDGGAFSFLAFLALAWVRRRR
jgi:MYXO-CTERM domain-containing protein